MNAEDFACCWNENAPLVIAYASRQVGREAAHDITSATFLTAWRTWASVPPHALPWLLSAARNHIRNHERSSSRQDSLARRLLLIGDVAATAQDASVTAAARSEAVAALAALSEKEREALLLVTWDGLTTDEAARVVRCRPSTFRSRLRRARIQLQGIAHDQLDEVRTTNGASHG